VNSTNALASILSPSERKTHQRLTSGRSNGGGRTPIENVRVSAYRIPTDAHESDGTFEWDATTLVLVEVNAGDVTVYRKT
jgi:hypothetical protein